MTFCWLFQIMTHQLWRLYSFHFSVFFIYLIYFISLFLCPTLVSSHWLLQCHELFQLKITQGHHQWLINTTNASTTTIVTVISGERGRCRYWWHSWISAYKKEKQGIKAKNIKSINKIGAKQKESELRT